MHKILENILNLPRFAKQSIAFLCDLILCMVCTIFAFYLRLDELVSLNGPALIATFVSIFLALPLFWLMGLYRTVFRYSGYSIMFSVSLSILIYGSLSIGIFTLYVIPGVPRSIGIIQPMLLFFAIASSRLLVKYLLGNNINKNTKVLKPTLIYGAGLAGQQLLTSLKNSLEFKVVGFLDDDTKLQSQEILNLTVYSPEMLKEIIDNQEVELVFLALPSISRYKRNKIINSLSKHKVKIQTLPSISDIVAGKVTISDIKDLDINDLLNRDIVIPKKDLMIKNVSSQVVLVTGAGGSIGSELCRQILKYKPKSLILLEISEYGLYQIYEELISASKTSNIVPLLGNVQDENKLNEICVTFKVNTIYHAAAYKHVPLVEENIFEGVKNNVFATYNVANVAIKNLVSNFVLISSDKAVRPTNIMGATKRFAELCVQALYHNLNNPKIKMSIVRFGNVLESSGSVIPKFKHQIKLGGPITLTHSDVTRFFMTIKEASQLVIQAGAMSNNCDVFVLDMGKSVKIKELAQRLVELSGLTIKDEENPDGDIEIKIIGLRPGEKLYEELLLGNNPQPTNHPRIQKAEDPHISFSELKKNLKLLNNLITTNQVEDVKKMLKIIVKSYTSNSKIVDNMYIEKEKIKKINTN